MTPTKRKCLSLLLEGGELRGPELVERSDGVLKRGEVYVDLHQLEEEKLVWSRLGKPVAEGVTRPRVYSLTPDGRTTAEALQAELTAAIGASDADRTEQHKP